MVWDFLKKKRHPIVEGIFQVLIEEKFEDTFINSVHQDGDILHVNIHLPYHKECSDLEEILPNLQQEVGATAVKLGKVNGKYVEILFGMRKLENINWNESFLHPDTLQIELPSAYGKHILDFEDGASCHMLNGGVTRMGKTIFLLYVATTIFIQNKGNVELYISSAKLKDYYPFEGIPQVKMGKDMKDMNNMLDDIIAEYKKRNDLLYSPRFRKATDSKSIRKLYPESYHLFKPVFLIIDEYARFAESREVQRKVTEIVETAGFVNIHVIIASQRPDASSVLKPRIRANLLTRLAFTTADRKNSEVILDRGGAEKLGKIAGRGILIDSDNHTIQVPYLDVLECDKLLEPYRREITENEQITERFIDSEVIDKIQSLITESDSLLDLQGQFQSGQCSESGIKTNGIEWSHFPDSKGKR